MSIVLRVPQQIFSARTFLPEQRGNSFSRLITFRLKRQCREA